MVTELDCYGVKIKFPFVPYPSQEIIQIFWPQMTGWEKWLGWPWRENKVAMINVTWGQGHVDVDSDHIRFSAWLNSFEAVKDTRSGFKDTLPN